MEKKWLWIIFILLGIGRVGINWTTGQILFNPFSFHIQLLGSACFKLSTYAPWILSTSLPLGAILFLIKRKKLLIQDNENREKNSSESAPSNSDTATAESE